MILINFCTFTKAEIDQIIKRPEITKKVFLELLDFPNLISHKIWRIKNPEISALWILRYVPLSHFSVYLESGTSTVANEITFKTTTSTGNRKWRVQIIQYECESLYKAPPDCLQYHTGVSGTFSSFNFGNIMITSTSYVICIRQELGYCNIGYSTNEINGSEYALSNTGNSISKVWLPFYLLHFCKQIAYDMNISENGLLW